MKKGIGTPTMAILFTIVISIIVGAIIFSSVYDSLNPFKENTEETTDNLGEKIEDTKPDVYVANIPTISESSANSEAQALFNPTPPPVEQSEIPSAL